MNNYLFTRSRLAMAVALATAISPAMAVEEEAEVTETVAVESEPLPLLGGDRIIPEEGRGVAADGGELLRDVPGVSGSRLGGKGIDAESQYDAGVQAFEV